MQVHVIREPRGCLMPCSKKTRRPQGRHRGPNIVRVAGVRLVHPEHLRYCELRRASVKPVAIRIEPTIAGATPDLAANSALPSLATHPRRSWKAPPGLRLKVGLGWQWTRTPRSKTRTHVATTRHGPDAISRVFRYRLASTAAASHALCRSVLARTLVPSACSET